MPPDADVLGYLRAADQHLSAVAPGAHLEARIRARLRGQAPSSQGPFGGRRIGRPLMLAFAAMTVMLLVLSGRARHADKQDAMASSPSAAPSATPERIHGDGGPPDVLDGPRRDRPPRPIHAPALDILPVRRDRDPTPVRPVAAPPSSREDTRPPDPMSIDPGNSSPALPPGRIADAPFTPLLAGPQPATTSPAHPHQSLGHDAPARSPAPSSSPPAPAAPEGDDPNADCKSPDELSVASAVTCKEKGLVVDKVVYLGPCGDGRFRGASATCMEANQPDPKPEGCKVFEFGDGVTCQDFTEFPPKEQLMAECTQVGLQLQEISTTTSGCPDGQWNKGTYQCCKAPAPPPPSQCTGGELGDGVTCQDLATLKQLSTDACQKVGGTLTDVHKVDVIGESCSAGEWSIATYTCCGPVPQDPCTYSKVGDGLTCQDEGALLQQAADMCAAVGLSAQAAKPSYDCPGGQSTWASIACCPP